MEEKSFSIKPCLVGTVFLLVQIIIFTVIIALVANMTSVNENTVKIASYIIMALSGIFGGILAGKGTRRRGVISGASVGILGIIFIKLIEFVTTGTVTFNDGFYISSISLFVSSLIGGVIGVN